MRENWPIFPPQVGLTVGRQAGRPAEYKIQVDFEILKILYKLFGWLFCLIYHCKVIIVLELHLSQLFSSKAYIKVSFEVQKIQLPFFSCQSLLLDTNMLRCVTMCYT